MYKAIVTYNFSDNDTRDSFTELLVDLGFENQPDQSTYVIADENEYSIKEIIDNIIQWSIFEASLTHDDGVQIYHAYRKILHGGKSIPSIGVCNLKSNRGNNKLEQIY